MFFFFRSHTYFDSFGFIFIFLVFEWFCVVSESLFEGSSGIADICSGLVSVCSQWPCKPLLVLGSFRLGGNLLFLGSCRISWLVRLCFPPSWSYGHCGTWWWSSCFACNYSWLWLCFCWRFYEACVQQGSALWLTWWIAPLRLSSHLHRRGGLNQITFLARFFSASLWYRSAFGILDLCVIATGFKGFVIRGLQPY